MNHTPSKPWYKPWWGMILAVLILPVFLIWLIWTKAHWHTVGKIAATAGVIFLVLWFYSELELLQITHTLSRDSHNLTIQSPAYNLAAYDLGHTPDASTVAQYQQALDGLQPFCLESEDKLAGEVWTSEKDLRRNGITHETNLTLLGHIRGSFQPSGPHSKSPQTDCLGILSAYLSLREPLIRK